MPRIEEHSGLDKTLRPNIPNEILGSRVGFEGQQLEVTISSPICATSRGGWSQHRSAK